MLLGAEWSLEACPLSAGAEEESSLVTATAEAAAVHADKPESAVGFLAAAEAAPLSAEEGASAPSVSGAAVEGARKSGDGIQLHTASAVAGFLRQGCSESCTDGSDSASCE